MEKLNLSRRNFVKMAVATGSVAALSSAGATTALAATGDATPQAGEIKRIRTVCRACGKMECGVWVTVQDGKALMVEGDQTCFTSQGNCCTKSQSSIQACYHPDRLRYPMKRTGAKFEDPKWQRISWDEAMDIAGKKFHEVSDKYTGTGIFGMNGTSRMWAMGGYATLNIITGGKNNHVASCVCKGPRFLTTSTTDMYGSNWMTSGEEPDVYVEWGGNIEYSNYDDSCRNVVNASQKAKTFIIVDPRLTGIGKEADYWLNVRPGTDQAIALAWAKLIIDNKLTDDLYLKRWTVAPFLVVKDMEPTGGELIDDGGSYDMKTRMLKMSDIAEDGDYFKFIVLDKTKVAAGAEGNDRFSYYDVNAAQWEGEHITTDAAMSNGKWVNKGTEWEGWLPEPTKFDSIDPDLYGDIEVTLKDGTVHKATTTFKLLVEMLADKTPEWAEARTGVDAAKIKDACLAWATPIDPSRGYGNGGIHISLAMDQNGMNYQTIRCIMMLCHLTGNMDIPGANRGPTHAYFRDECWLPYFAIAGNSTAYKEHKFVTSAQRAGGDKWPMTRWYSQWTEPATLWRAIIDQDPYPIVAGANDSGSFMNMSNSGLAWEAMNKLDFWLEANLWHHPTADCADILVPVYHWIEIEFPRISQGPHCGLAMNVPCVDAPGDCKDDPMFLKALAKGYGFPWSFTHADGGYSLTTHDSCVEMYRTAQETSLDSNGESLPWATWDEFAENFQKNGWVNSKKYYPKEMGTYRRWETGYTFLPPSVGGAKGFVDLNVEGCDKYRRFGYLTATGKYEGFWPVVLETFCQGGIGNIDIDWQTPDWRAPEQNRESNPELFKEYPLLATTGRRIPVYFHSEHRQLPWCREQWPVPRIEINPADAAKLGIEQGDWCWIETKWGKIRQCADLYYGIDEGNVNLEHAWWFPELSAPNHGESLTNCNRLLDPDYVDPIMASPCMRGFAVKVYKATPENSPFNNPVPCDDDGTEIIHDASDPRLKKWLPDYSLNGKEY